MRKSLRFQELRHANASFPILARCAIIKPYGETPDPTYQHRKVRRQAGGHRPRENRCFGHGYKDRACGGETPLPRATWRDILLVSVPKGLTVV